MNLEVELKSKGWYLSNEGIDICKEGLEKITVLSVISRAMNMDLREIGANFLTDETPKGKVDSISGPCVLQIQKIKNASAPKYEYCAGAPPILRLLLTDGNTYINCLQWSQWKSITMDTPPGTKIYLNPGKIQMQNGFILLNEKQFSVLGGCVASLVEKWEISRQMASVASHVRTNENRDGAAPPWIPFGKPIVSGNSKTIGGNFRSLDQDAKEAKENVVFKQQRQANIAEVSRVKEGKVKVFGGGKDLKPANNMNENSYQYEQVNSTPGSDKSSYRFSQNSNEFQSSNKSFDKQNTYNSFDKQNSYNSFDKQNSYNSFAKQNSYNSFDKQNSYNSFDKQNSYNSFDKQNSYNSFDKQNSYNSFDKHNSYNSFDKQNSYTTFDKQSSSGSSDKQNAYNPFDRKNAYNSFDKQSSYNDRTQKASRNDSRFPNREPVQGHSPPVSDTSYQRQKNFKSDIRQNFKNTTSVTNQSSENPTALTQKTTEKSHYRNYEENLSQGYERNCNRNENYNASSSKNQYGSKNDNFEDLAYMTSQMRLYETENRGNSMQETVAVKPFIKPGVEVKAKYWEDNKYYPAIVHAVGSDGTTCVVHFTEYGNYEEVLVKDIQEVSTGWNVGPISFQPSHWNTPENHSYEDFSGGAEFRRGPRKPYSQRFGGQQDRQKAPRHDSRPAARLYQPPHQRQPS